jgi:putative polymerase
VAALWALFVYSPVHDHDALRFKNFVAFYYVAVLPIAASVFTIKTAALLWFLYGTLNNSTAQTDPAVLPVNTVG